MKIKSLKLGLLLLTGVLIGCAGTTKTPQSFTFAPESFPSGQYTARADNVQFILDASQTMANCDNRGFRSAKGFLGAVNQSLPADYAANAGLRSFGHSERQSKNLTDLVYGMTKYSRDGLQKGLDSVKYAGGTSPLGAAINAASVDLEKAAGTSALVIVSDATQNVMDDAVGAAQAIKKKMGDKLCIYTVWVGDDLVGQKALEKVATSGSCGFSQNIAALNDQKSLAAFVEKALLTGKSAPAPAAAAPAPAPVATPAMAPVPAPAPMAKEVITFNLQFDFDKSNIREDMVPVLEKAKQILNEDRAVAFTVMGHTCNIGTDAYNQGLSERRAASVKNWLVNNGVAAERLDPVGFGELRPKYDNQTREGRQLNRRVELQSK